MSVLVRGMEMPTSCTRCIFSGWSNLYQFRCVLQKDEPVLYDCRHDKSIAVVMDGRADKCPLVPIPPHGRLIDADALPWEKQGLLAADEDWAIPCSVIENAPTIIPAEEGEE